MVVCGFGAAGSAGKASSARVLGGGGPRDRVAEEEEDDDAAVHDGAEAAADTRAAVDEDDDEEGGGRDGNADADGALEDDEALEDEAAGTQPGGPLNVLGAGPPNRVLFFSFRTLVEFRCDGATMVKPVFAAAALAQPLELDVAPCMPPSPGRLG